MPYILKNSIKSLIVAGMCALLAAVFAFVRKDDQGFSGIALFASSSALLLLAGTDASQLLWRQPLMWEYLEAGSYYMVPVALGVMLAQWRGTRPARLLRRLWQLHLLYLALALGASLLGLVTLASTYPVFDGLFLVSLIIMSAMALFDIRQMSGEQRLLLAVFGVYCLLLIADMAVAHGFLPWVRVPVSWGYNSNPSSPFTNSSPLPETFDGLINLPPPTRLFADIRDLPPDDTDLPGALHNLCFSMDQIIQKIGLTLSGVLLHQDLQRLSYEDALTGLHNRRFFDRLMKHEIAVCRRSQRSLTLLIADVDHFKRFNDDYGHEAGDLVLQRIASELAPALRESDTVCRYGGEEFVVLMAGASSAQAQAKAEALADKALYRAKRNGRNRVEVSSSG